VAVKTYGATFNNGAAALSYGKGTISGDVNVDVQGASLGCTHWPLPPAARSTPIWRWPWPSKPFPASPIEITLPKR